MKRYLLFMFCKILKSFRKYIYITLYLANKYLQYSYYQLSSSLYHLILDSLDMVRARITPKSTTINIHNNILMQTLRLLIWFVFLSDSLSPALMFLFYNISNNVYNIDLPVDFFALIAKLPHDVVGCLLGLVGGPVHELYAVYLVVELLVCVD